MLTPLCCTLPTAMVDTLMLLVLILPTPTLPTLIPTDMLDTVI
jgi:hypothetical protein